MICRKWLKKFGSFLHRTGARLRRPALLSTCFHRKPSCYEISLLIKWWRSAQFQYSFASFWERRWHLNENHNHCSQDNSAPVTVIIGVQLHRRKKSKSTISMPCILDTKLTVSAEHFRDKGCKLVLQSLCKQPSAVCESLRWDQVSPKAKVGIDTTPLCAHLTHGTDGNIIITITQSGGVTF